jgi:hypothetical protein
LVLSNFIRRSWGMYLSTIRYMLELIPIIKLCNCRKLFFDDSKNSSFRGKLYRLGLLQKDCKNFENLSSICERLVAIPEFASIAALDKKYLCNSYQISDLRRNRNWIVKENLINSTNELDFNGLQSKFAAILSSGRTVHDPAWSDESVQNFHRWKLFVIWRSLHYIHLFLESALPKPEIPYSILPDRHSSKSLAEIQQNSSSSATWVRSSSSFTVRNKWKSPKARPGE